VEKMGEWSSVLAQVKLECAVTYSNFVNTDGRSKLEEGKEGLPWPSAPPHNPSYLLTGGEGIASNIPLRPPSNTVT